MDFQILLTPFVALLIAQISKSFIRSNNTKLSFKNLFVYSGMPSGHSALIISMATIIGLKVGFDSPAFAIAVVLSTVVIRDALGIRRYLGEHGKTLNVLVNDLKDDKVLEQKYPHLLEKIGHTPVQVIVGSIIGFLVGLLSYLLF